MHATIEQLLAIRDREPVAAAIKQHADNCPLCGARLRDLSLARRELQRLPVQPPRRDYWPDIQLRLAQDQPAAWQRRYWARYGGTGLAAMVFSAALLFLNSMDNAGYVNNPPADTAAPRAAGRLEPPAAASRRGDDAAVKNAPDAGGNDVDLELLIARSARLEAVLHALPERPRVVRAGTADLITGLQEGVALIDYQLNLDAGDPPSPTAHKLWQQRVDLMNSLVNVRYAEMQRVAYTPN